MTSVTAITGAPLRRDSRAGLERRHDIDGLRAFAILLVVVYHVWLGRVSGGVDVFLMVSAYFLTASFLRLSATLRPADLMSFWSRRFARLMPAAAVTIVGVLAFAFVILPGSQWRDIWAQSWSSLFYVQNRELVASAVDYYARTETFPSPLQHFWSLSIQGQVFLLWPILILAAVSTARLLNVPPRLILSLGFGGLFVVSLAYSVVLTSADQQVAYFSMPARLWEFALGALAALVLPALRLPGYLANMIGWAGLLALIACGVVLDVGAGFPGFAALWPTMAAIAVMVAGQTDKPTGIYRFLASRPLIWVGGIAYALYLVHWPILVGYMKVTDSTVVGVVGGGVVIALSLLAAVGLTRWVERPIASLTGSVKRNVAVVLVSVLAVSFPLMGWQLTDAVRAASGDPNSNPGAEVLMPWLGTRTVPAAPVVPASTQLDNEWVVLGESCTGSFMPRGELAAESCLQRGDATDAPLFLAIGDSHAQQWLGSLLPILDDAGWNTVSVMKGGCSFGPDEAGDEDCIEWREQALDYAEAQPADVVMLMGTKASPSSNDERTLLGLERELNPIRQSGSQVLLVRDNPRFDFDMYQCVETARSADDCAVPLANALAATNPAADLVEVDGVHTLDLTEYLCPESICQPVIGNVAVYLDDNHLTWSYARSMAPAALAALREMPGIPLG